MSTISIRTLMGIRYNKKNSILNKLSESATIIKKKFENSKTVRDIKYIIESWTGISSSPDSVTCQVINKLDSFNEKEQKEIINTLDKELLHRISSNCLMNITEELSQKENPNYYLLEKLDQYRVYNRVNENYEKINNRLGISNIIKESEFNKFDDDEYKTKVLTNITESIYNTYTNVKELYRFNIILESILYGFNCVGIRVSEPLILQTVSEYFVNHSELSQDDIKKVITEMNLYSEDSKEKVLSLFESQEKLSNGLVKDKFSNIKQICDSYKLQIKSATNLRNVMTKIYARGIDECVEDTPHILGIIATTVTSVGIGSINPVLGILTAFAQYMVSKNMDIEQTAKYLEDLKAERTKVKRKLDKKESEELTKYLERLEVCIEKIENYRTTLLSDEENEDEFDNLDDDFLEQTFVINYGLLRCFSEAIDNDNQDDINILHNMISEKTSLIDESGELINSVKLVKEKLKQTAKKLSTKEKALCSQMDDKFDIFVRDLQRAMSTEKRERVIKGKIGPSLSGIIKMAVVGGISALINPAITVIGLLGGYAISKKATIREKQYILDELAIQLKIVERKINQAEIKGDDKALEELYRLQSRLEKEQKRIKYNIKLYHESGCVL